MLGEEKRIANLSEHSLLPAHGAATAEQKRRCIYRTRDGEPLYTPSYFIKSWTGMAECPEVYQAPERGWKLSRKSQPTRRSLMSGRRKMHTDLHDVGNRRVLRSNGFDRELGTKDGWCGFLCRGPNSGHKRPKVDALPTKAQMT